MSEGAQGGKAMGADEDGDMLPEDDLPEFEDDPEKTPLAPLGLEEQRLEDVHAQDAMGAKKGVGCVV